MRGAWLAPALALALAAAASRAQQGDGIVAVTRPTGDDAAALAARVKFLEERLESLWSLRQGPDIMAIDTIDRLATRLLSLEARQSEVEEATGVRQARAAHGHGGDGAFEVAVALVLLDHAVWSDAAAEAGPVRDATIGAQLRLRQAVRAATWPRGLEVKARQLDDAWQRWIRAVSANDAPAVAQRAGELAILRRDLVAASSNWVASMALQGGGAHDHSGGAAGAHADHSPHHGGQVGMKGDVHVEIVSDGPGAWRVFLTDMFRQPMTATGWTGEIVLFPDDDAPGSVGLAPSPDATWLQATAPPAGRSPVDVRVQLVAPEEIASQLGPEARKAQDRRLAMDFQFGAEGPASGMPPATVHPPDCPMNPARLGQPPAAAAGSPPSRPRRWR